MDNNEIDKSHNNSFQSIRKVGKEGEEFWFARDLQQVLEYSEWRNFESVIRKAITACEKTVYNQTGHFVGVNKKVTLGSGAVRKVDNIESS